MFSARGFTATLDSAVALMIYRQRIAWGGSLERLCKSRS